MTKYDEIKYEYNPEERSKNELYTKMDNTMNKFLDTRYIKASNKTISFKEKVRYHHLFEETTTTKRKGLELIIPMPYHRLSKTEYMPSGDVLFFNVNSKVSPLMFNPKRTCELMMKFPVELDITHKKMSDPKFRASVNKIMAQYKQSDCQGPSLETYGISTEFLNKGSKLGPPKLSMSQVEILKDTKKWNACLGSGVGHDITLQFTNDKCYIVVFSCAEKSSMEFHRITQWYAKRCPRMKLCEFMEKTVWYKLHHWNCYRNGARLAYNFACAIKACIKHKVDSQAVLTDQFESCRPKMGIPCTKQELNYMMKLKGVRPRKYVKYLDELASNKHMCCKDSMKYFSNKTDCYAYFNDCTPNYLYSPQSRKYIGDIFASCYALTSTDENNELQQKYVESCLNGKEPNHNSPLYQEKMIKTGDKYSFYESIMVDEKLTFDNKSLDSHGPGFVAFPCFSNKKPVKEQETKKVMVTTTTIGNSLLSSLNKNKQIKKESLKDETHFMLYNGDSHKFAGKDAFYGIKKVKATLRGMGFLKGFYQVTEMKPYLTKYSNKK